MRLFQFACCFLMLVFAFSEVVAAQASAAQTSNDKLPSAPIVFGQIGVKEGKFQVTELVTVYEQMTQEYSVTVPYQEIVDGTTVTKTRLETRTRTITVPRLQANAFTVPDEAISFSTLSGRPVKNLDAVRQSLATEPRPATIRYAPGKIEDYYQKALDSKVVVVHIDRRKLPANNAPAPEAPAPSIDKK